MFDKLEGLEIASIENHNATVVSVSYVIPNEAVITATGSSRRHPDDRYDPDLGYQLAFARALESLSRKLAKRAQRRIHLNDIDAHRRKKANKVVVTSAVAQPAEVAARPGLNNVTTVNRRERFASV